jgi:hypothetical protein
MKFYGVKMGISGDIISNCVLIVKISSVNNLFACYNTERDCIEVYYRDSDTILYKDTSFLELSGTWVLISFSSYNSNLGDYSSTSYYPLMFSFAINGLTISQTSNTITEPGIIVDTITIGSGISSTFTDIRVYKSFILNPYGIVTNDEYMTYEWATVGEGEPTELENEGKKVAELEYFTHGWRGDTYRMVGWPRAINTKYMVDPSSSYDLIDIHYFYQGTGVSVQQSEKEITIAVPAGNSTVLSAIESLMGSNKIVAPETFTREVDDGNHS